MCHLDPAHLDPAPVNPARMDPPQTDPANIVRQPLKTGRIVNSRPQDEDWKIQMRNTKQQRGGLYRETWGAEEETD